MDISKKYFQARRAGGQDEPILTPKSLADNAPKVSMRSTIYLGIVLVISWSIVLFGAINLSQVAGLYAAEISVRPYFQPEHAMMLYLVTPIVVLSSSITFLMPGLCLSLAAGQTENWTGLIIKAFGTSFIAYFFLTAGAKLLVEPPAAPGVFLIAIAGGGALAWSFLAWRVYNGVKLPWPLSHAADIRRLGWTIVIPVVFLVTLLPIFFWQDFHDDAIEGFEIGRSLSTYILPRFPTPTGMLGLNAGMTPMAYPIHWFITLAGPIEAAARLPMLLYLPVLFCLLIQLIEWRSPRSLGLREELVLFLALAIFTVTMSYNSSYDPYFADIAAPTAFEMLTAVSILAAIYFLWSGQNFWFFFFALLSYLCRPTGLMVLGFLAIAVLISVSERRMSWLARIASAILLCVLVGFIYDKIYIPFMIGDAEFGYGFSSTLRRFRFLTLDDLPRFGYVMFPSGIIPFLSLLAYRWQDSLGRFISIVSILYFILFYFQAFVALHYFVPVMILPLVVFWRLYLHQSIRFQRVSLPAVAITSIMALWLSLPQHFEINRTARSIGQRTAYLIGDYDTNYREQVKHFDLFFELIPPDWQVKDPSTELVSGYGSLIYYATRPKPANTTINYIIQPSKAPAPPGFTRVAEDTGAILYVQDLEQWQRDRFQTLRTDYRSPLYDISRATLFRHWGEPQENYTIDLKYLLLGYK